MNREFLIRAVCLYWPLLAAGVLWGLVRPGYFVRVGLLIAVCWNMAVLPWVNWLAQEAGWWGFRTDGPAVLGMPLELYLGWAAWWGVVVPLCGWRLAGKTPVAFPLAVVVVAVLVDVAAMPMLAPVVVLDDGWWTGEVLLVVAALMPGALGMWWTGRRVCVGWRTAVQGVAFGLLLLGVVPCVVDHGLGWLGEGLQRPWWQSGLLGGLAVVFAALGIAGAREFVVVGRGTPLPFDPPQRLVTTGVYRWVANPMQLSMVGLCLVWWLWFGLWWLLGLGLLGVVYSEGLARWSEREDHRARFGDEWREYRKRVRRWVPRRGAGD